MVFRCSSHYKKLGATAGKDVLPAWSHHAIAGLRVPLPGGGGGGAPAPRLINLRILGTEERLAPAGSAGFRHSPCAGFVGPLKASTLGHPASDCVLEVKGP